uniref:Alternative protein RBM15B n=1 Tax=Homo sapiens TaxID=9606 RepID=L8EAN0_HUMAN|nr:alternative protein RBM15B [Homo sapiens]
MWNGQVPRKRASTFITKQQHKDMLSMFIYLPVFVFLLELWSQLPGT